ncbi:MAG: hypothetical protein OK441_04250 [Thaumarchaeota archaeon]|nr:hypothetical protein [Nitrososphaerota archaeon]
MVEGRVVFGSLVPSVAIVAHSDILGLRCIGGTLGCQWVVGSFHLTVSLLAVIWAC